MAIATFANNTSSGTGTVSGGGTFTVTKPTGCANGDVVWIFAGTSDSPVPFSSPDLTQLYAVDETGTDSALWVARRVIAGDGATWTVTSTNTKVYAYVCVALRGVDNTTPEGATVCASAASSASQVCGPITVTNAGAWILAAAECDTATPGPVYTGPGGAFVLDVTIAEGTAFNGIGVGHEDLAGATGSTSRTLTSSIADVYVSALLEINPAATGTPQKVRPDADTAVGTWATAPLWSKVDEASAGGDVITDTAA